MHRTCLLLWLLAPLALLVSAAPALADHGVRDDAHFFKDDTVADANRMIDDIYRRHHRDVMVETLASIPQDKRDQFQEQGKETFFKNWGDEIFRDSNVNGVLILICKDPPHIQVRVGNQTSATLFLPSDREQLNRVLTKAFREKQFDQGLLAAVRFVGQRIDAHGSTGAAAQRSPGTYAPPPASPPYPMRHRPAGWGISGMACFLIAIVLGVILIGSIFGRRGGTYYGGGQYPPGNYPPGGYPPGGYPPGGYGYGGGGGGFGRGFLGGLLGGALGGYAAEKWTEHQNQGGQPYVPPPTGDTGTNPDWNIPADTSSSATDSDFGSDSGSSGADFGGGGDLGGGGGGDFGGGGDSGSSGGDF